MLQWNIHLQISMIYNNKKLQHSVGQLWDPGEGAAAIWGLLSHDGCQEGKWKQAETGKTSWSICSFSNKVIPLAKKSLQDLFIRCIIICLSPWTPSAVLSLAFGHSSSTAEMSCSATLKLLFPLLETVTPYLQRKCKFRQETFILYYLIFIVMCLFKII